VLDPYSENPPLPPLKTQANAAYKSHEHSDHSNLEAVELIPFGGDSPFRMTEIPTFHDDACGVKRGANIIRVFDVAGLRIAHFGDLGHKLSTEQAAAVGRCDAVMIPVGGFFTIEPDVAKEIILGIDPKVTIPMHYRPENGGMPMIKTVADFIALWEDRPVYKYKTSLDITPDIQKQIAILDYVY
jgi:L-ascorbate metabolism protein UlaG (beta-lactamase superfamily)